jgi:hypothetical protein
MAAAERIFGLLDTPADPRAPVLAGGARPGERVGSRVAGRVTLENGWLA